jgi:hypothetical protein
MGDAGRVNAGSISAKQPHAPLGAIERLVGLRRE